MGLQDPIAIHISSRVSALQVRADLISTQLFSVPHASDWLRVVPNGDPKTYFSNTQVLALVKFQKEKEKQKTVNKTDLCCGIGTNIAARKPQRQQKKTAATTLKAFIFALFPFQATFAVA